MLKVVKVDYRVIDMALKSSWKDFEDAVQNFAAETDEAIDAIITRNKKDFEKSNLEIVDSIDFLS